MFGNYVDNRYICILEYTDVLIVQDKDLLLVQEEEDILL